MKVLWEREVEAEKVRVSPRPVWKCMACPMYGRRPGCPPSAPRWQEAREWVRSFKRALIVKFEVDMDRFEEEKREVLLWLLNREARLFREGHVYAFALFPGSCNLCDPCPYEVEGRCRMPDKVRPSLDAVGIELTSVVELDFSENVLYGIVFIE
ncbi:MAG: DUF2284 domain-containing protein [Thermococci archaeon]|nr:DUF2284 domain-containing protein [Thermococci archaeon]